MATRQAVDESKRLDEIGFPEFTAKLVGDTFDALIMANLKQTESYIGLVQEVSKSLSAYINDTKDDSSSAEVLGFLEAILPAAASDSENDTSIAPAKALTVAEAKTLNDALALPPTVDDNLKPSVYPAEQANALGDSYESAEWKGLLDAVAVRIAANKYTLLQEMVKQGILRLVVENGTIETRMTFTTYGSSSMTRDTSSYARDTTNKRSSSGAGFIFAPLFSAKQRTYETKLRVSTTKTANRDISGSRVQIYGGVLINFKTDYQPLT